MLWEKPQFYILSLVTSIHSPSWTPMKLHSPSELFEGVTLDFLPETATVNVSPSVCCCTCGLQGVVMLWFWGWGNEHHNEWRRQLWGRHVIWRELRVRRPAVVVVSPGLEVSGVPSVLTAALFGVETRTRGWGEDMLVEASCRVVCGRCRPALKRCQGVLCLGVVWRREVPVVTGDDICVKVSTSCCECSVSVQVGNTFTSV